MGIGFEIHGTANSVQLSELDGEDIEVGDPVSSKRRTSESTVRIKPAFIGRVYSVNDRCRVVPLELFSRSMSYGSCMTTLRVSLSGRSQGSWEED